MITKGYYISPHAASSLVNFKYCGASLSPVYKYILSPLANFFVEFLPTWIAPNVITTFGLIWMIVSYILICYYCPSFTEGLLSEEQVPRSIFLFNGLAMLIYQTLDNMDGKQARRTGSSSALGLFFDHGCDAFNCVLISANLRCAMGVTPSDVWQCAAIEFSSFGIFYMATWEEYHTHKLIQNYLNFPTEGLIGMAIISFTSFVYGVTYWHQTTIWDNMAQFLMPDWLSQMVFESFGGLFQQNNEIVAIRNLDCVCIALILIFAIEVFSKLSTVIRSTKSYSTLLSLLPLLTLVTLSSLVVIHNPNIFLQNPRTCLHLSCLLFCEIDTQLMLDHMTNQEHQPYRLCLLPILCFFLLPKNDDLSQYSFLLLYTIGMAVYMGMKVRLVIWEMCHAMRIWFFDIVTPFYHSIEKDQHGSNASSNDVTKKRRSVVSS